ncbi:MAG TPA: ABC transporter ATP-binding protein [Bacillota bacterium]|nr:ABC transporter ATP-binding protein [Bacillota bacterium]
MGNLVEPRVILSNVTKQIGGKTIVDHLSLQINPGEVFGLLGPNGAGKTTTIRMIVGLISLTEGEISINGWDIKRDFTKAIAQVGAIVENPEFYLFMSGYQNLLHYAKLHAEVTRERIDEVVQQVGLAGRITDPVKTYSLGMRQRLGVAQALLHHPSVLILDEPTNGLDPAGIRELRTYLRHLAETKGVSVIVSSHLLTEMELMCDRTAIIKDGRLLDVKVVGDNFFEPKIIFQVDNPSQAGLVIQSQHLATHVLNTEAGLEVTTERERIPEIVNCLVRDGIKIYGIQAKTKSLEDIFMEVTAVD